MNSCVSIHRVYRLTILFGVLGAAAFSWLRGPREGLAFALGALGSFGNLWLFHRLSFSIAPGEVSRKPWQASAFIGRYFILFALGYVIVKGLGVNPLPVVLGLFASTAAVLTSSIFELLLNLWKNTNSG
jgi:ATP synthase I subunit